MVMRVFEDIFLIVFALFVSLVMMISQRDPLLSILEVFLKYRNIDADCGLQLFILLDCTCESFTGFHLWL